MKTSIVWAVVCIMVSMNLCACGSSSSSSDTNAVIDSITIISVSPASAVTGTNTSFAIDVSYSLATKDSGMVMVGFNTSQVGSFIMISSQEHIVTKGSGTHTFTATAAPVDWGAAGSFQAHVILAENPHPSSFSPLASDTKTISLSTGPAPGVGRSESAFMQIFNPIQCTYDVCFSSAVIPVGPSKTKLDNMISTCE